MTVIAAGIGVSGAFDGQRRPIDLPAIDHPDQTASLVETLRSHLPDGEPAIAVVPTWGPPPQRAAYATARRVLGPHRLLIVDTSLPPLAAALVVAGLGRVLQRFARAEAAVSLASAIESQIVSLAWTSSVAGLEHVDVPMSLHARSYVSRRGFVVRVAPAPSARPADGSALDLGLPEGSRALVADVDGNETWRGGVLREALRPAKIDLVSAPEASKAWWGARRFIEVAATVGTPDALLSAALAKQPLVDCAWCGEPSRRERCDRCGAGLAMDTPVGVGGASLPPIDHEAAPLAPPPGGTSPPALSSLPPPSPDPSHTEHKEPRT